MEQDGKKVLVPWDEYQDLLKDSEALKEAKEELKRDCKERGLYVETTLYWPRYDSFDERLLRSRLDIFCKDEVLELAQKEMDRISLAAKDMVEEKERTIDRLLKRNLWQRIINKR